MKETGVGSDSCVLIHGLALRPAFCTTVVYFIMMELKLLIISLYGSHTCITSLKCSHFKLAQHFLRECEQCRTAAEDRK